MAWDLLVGSAALAFVTTLVATRWLIRLLRHTTMVGHDLHKVHRPLVPEMGGLAVVAGFYAGVTMLELFATDGPSASYLHASLVAAFGAAFAGLLDDLFRLRHRAKAILPALFAIPLGIVAYRDPAGGTILLNAGSQSSVLNYCDVEYGGSSNAAELYLLSNAAVQNSTVRSSASNGLRVTSANPALTAVTLQSNASSYAGLYLEGTASPTLTQCRFQSNTHQSASSERNGVAFQIASAISMLIVGNAIRVGAWANSSKPMVITTAASFLRFMLFVPFLRRGTAGGSRSSKTHSIGSRAG